MKLLTESERFRSTSVHFRLQTKKIGVLHLYFSKHLDKTVSVGECLLDASLLARIRPLLWS